jgi:hypothetical protein
MGNSKYTHFKNLSVIESLAIGKKGSEVEVINEDGIVTADVEGNVTGYALKTEALIPTVAGDGTGQVAVDTTFATVTSADANHIITLPAPVIGRQITLVNGGTGYELRSSDPATIGINGGVGANAESAVGANLVVKLECVSLTNWIGSTVTSAGVVGVVQVAAP